MFAIGEVSSKFATTALGFLIDMFNDEDSEIRIDAVHCIAKLGTKWPLVLNDDCIKSVILILLDKDTNVRKLAYQMLRYFMCNKRVLFFQSSSCVSSIIKILYQNLVSNEQDREFIYNSLGGIAQNYPKLVGEMIPVFFELEKGLLPKEYRLDDKICKIFFK